MTSLPSPDTLARWDRSSRRWARGASVTVVLALLLPAFWVDRVGDLRLLWFWQARDPDLGPSDVLVSHREQEPIAVLWLLVAGFAWVAAKWDLVAKGRALTLATALVSALADRLVRHGGGERTSVWPLGWAHLSVFAAGLGLLFLWTGAARPAGRLLCLASGLLTLGALLVPVGDWSWPYLQHLSRLMELTGPERWFALYLLFWLLVGVLLVRLGAVRRPAQRLAAAVAALLGVTLLIGHVANHLFLREIGLETYGLLDEACALFATLRHWALPYAVLILLTVGVFAWVADARDPAATRHLASGD